jgi:hypothetical protein
MSDAFVSIPISEFESLHNQIYLWQQKVEEKQRIINTVVVEKQAEIERLTTQVQHWQDLALLYAGALGAADALHHDHIRVPCCDA